MQLDLILLVLSVVCLLASALNVRSDKVNLQSLGLALFVLTFLV